MGDDEFGPNCFFKRKIGGGEFGPNCIFKRKIGYGEFGPNYIFKRKSGGGGEFGLNCIIKSLCISQNCRCMQVTTTLQAVSGGA